MSLKEGYHWLGKESRARRNEFILRKRTEGWIIKHIAAQTNLAPRGVEEVLHVARRKAGTLRLDKDYTTKRVAGVSNAED